jgi:hypothetical protein
MTVGGRALIDCWPVHSTATLWSLAMLWSLACQQIKQEGVTLVVVAVQTQ